MSDFREASGYAVAWDRRSKRSDYRPYILPTVFRYRSVAWDYWLDLFSKLAEPYPTRAKKIARLRRRGCRRRTQ